MEIQAEIEDLVRMKQEDQIKARIKQFDMCTKEDQPMRRRAGLYGISVVTVALYQKGATQYLPQLVDPVITAFHDREFKV